VLILAKKVLGYILGDFLQPHLVTLLCPPRLEDFAAVSLSVTRFVEISPFGRFFSFF
jgi:hypothetical protein